MTVTTLIPFLMFEGAAEAAMTFYIPLFAGGAIVDIEQRYGAGLALLSVLTVCYRCAT